MLKRLSYLRGLGRGGSLAPLSSMSGLNCEDFTLLGCPMVIPETRGRKSKSERMRVRSWRFYKDLSGISKSAQ